MRKGHLESSYISFSGYGNIVDFYSTNFNVLSALFALNSFIYYLLQTPLNILQFQNLFITTHDGVKFYVEIGYIEESFKMAVQPSLYSQTIVEVPILIFSNLCRGTFTHLSCTPSLQIYIVGMIYLKKSLICAEVWLVALKRVQHKLLLVFM